MNTYLVVGGCGFVGFHVARRLLHNGHKVYTVDDLSGDGAQRNLADLQWGLHKFVRGDARDISAVPLPKPWEIERVVYAAARDGLYGTVDLHLRAVKALCQWASLENKTAPRGARPPRMLVVVAPDVELPAVAALQEHPEIQWRVARLFDVYGPRMSKRSVVRALLHRAMAGIDVEVGAGAERRSLIHVEDAATAIYLMVNRASLSQPVVDLGGDEWSMGDLARSIHLLSGAKGDLVVRDGPARHQVASASVYAEIGWRPKRLLPASMDEMRDWHSDGVDRIQQQEYGGV